MIRIIKKPVGYADTVRFDKRQYRKIKNLYRELRSLIENQDLERPGSEEFEELGRNIDHVSAKLYRIQIRAQKKTKGCVYLAMQRIEYAIIP